MSEFNKEFRVRGGSNEVWQKCKVVFKGKRYTVVENENGKEFSRKSVRITIRDITPEIIKENNMSELKEVEYQGSVYQIFAPYEFSDDGENWATDTLIGIGNGSGSFKYLGGFNNWMYCREIKSVGTITKAKAKLIDGEAYRFKDLNTNSEHVASYDEGLNVFITPGCYWEILSCTNIIPLVPAS